MSLSAYTAKTWTDYADSPDLSAVNVQYMDSGIAAVTAEVIALELALPSIYQPISAELSALAGISSTGYAKRTGAGAWSVVASIPQADVSGLTTALAGLQPLDSDLTAIAGLSTQAFGRSLLTAADAAAALSMVGAFPQYGWQTTSAVWTENNRIGSYNADGAATQTGGPTSSLNHSILHFGSSDRSTQIVSPYDATGLYYRKRNSGGWVGSWTTIWDSANLVGTRNEHNHAGVYQPLDADLTAISALATTGFVRRTATDTWAASAMAWADISGVISYGTTAGTVCQGNDSRLSDPRTPTPHVLDSASHTISGKTAGQLLLATSATTFGFVTMSGGATITAAGVVSLTNASVTGQALTGYAAGSNATLAATDTILAAFGKVQGQINARLTANQTITISGDVSGSGATSITATLASVITAGSSSGSGAYVPVLTWDAKGRLTTVTNRAMAAADLGLGSVENTALSTWAGSSNITTIGALASGTVPWARISGQPTTLSGYGISDAFPTYGWQTTSAVWTETGRIGSYNADGASTQTGGPTGSLNHAILHFGGVDRSTQIASPYDAIGIYYRKRNGNAGTWVGSWTTIWDSANLTNLSQLTNGPGYITAASLPVASSTTPSPLGTAAAGVGTTWARADHVHAMPTAAQVGAEPSITAGTTAQYWRGDKTWQALNAAAVGLGNVLNVAQEPALGNPGISGYVLASTTGGVRSWVALPSVPVSSVFGRSGAVTAQSGDYSAYYLGLTAQAADSAKLGGQLPSYYATAASLSGYLPISGGTLTGNLQILATDLGWGEGLRIVRAAGGWGGIRLTRTNSDATSVSNWASGYANNTSGDWEWDSVNSGGTQIKWGKFYKDGGLAVGGAGMANWAADSSLAWFGRDGAGNASSWTGFMTNGIHTWVGSNSGNVNINTAGVDRIVVSATGISMSLPLTAAAATFNGIASFNARIYVGQADFSGPVTLTSTLSGASGTFSGNLSAGSAGIATSSGYGSGYAWFGVSGYNSGVASSPGLHVSTSYTIHAAGSFHSFTVAGVQVAAISASSLNVYADLTSSNFTASGLISGSTLSITGLAALNGGATFPKATLTAVISGGTYPVGVYGLNIIQGQQSGVATFVKFPPVQSGVRVVFVGNINGNPNTATIALVQSGVIYPKAGTTSVGGQAITGTKAYWSDGTNWFEES